MNFKKKLLLIGTAPKTLIESTLKQVDKDSTELCLLVPERDRDCYPDMNVRYFEGNFHPFFLPLLKTMTSFRPDEVIVVCGMTYGHDNVVDSVNYYSHFKKFNLSISIRDEIKKLEERRPPKLFKEFFIWAGLAITAAGIKILEPLIRIRVGEIYASRLGHLAMETEIYLCEVELHRHEGTFDLFYFKDNKVSNQTLADLISRKLRINYAYRHVLDAVRRFNLADDHEITMKTKEVPFIRDSDCIMQQTENHLEFSTAQINKAEKEIRNLGLSPEAPHVCLFGRDSAYLMKEFPDNNDADMNEVRDMYINTLKPCTQYLLDQGFNVLRMGSEVKEPLAVSHPNFLDYSVSGKRTDFMDIYLSAKCSFFVGIQSGLMHIPMIFRIPCLSLNVVRLEIIHFCSPHDLAIFKLIWSKSEKRILTVQEQLESGISRWRVENFANSDFEVIDNTEDEILEATKELHKRVNGTWQTSEEDMDLQKRFRANFKPSYLNTQFVTPISAYFLRKHEKELL